MPCYLPRIRPINPHLVNLAGILAQILDMPEDMAAAVLADKVAQIRAEAHVRDGGPVQAPVLDGQAAEQDEALAVEEVGAQGVGEVGA